MERKPIPEDIDLIHKANAYASDRARTHGGPMMGTALTKIIELVEQRAQDRLHNAIAIVKTRYDQTPAAHFETAKDIIAGKPLPPEK